METGDMKFAITTKIFSQTTYLPLSLNNTVCIINLRQQFKRYVIDKSNGSITFNGLYPGPPLPISQIRLNLLNYKFTPFHLFPLLDSRLHDPSLSKYIAEVITGQASLSVGFLQRLFMFVNVVLTQEVFSVIPVSCLPKEETQEVEDESTCPICLENFLNDYVNDDEINGSVTLRSSPSRPSNPFPLINSCLHDPPLSQEVFSVIPKCAVENLWNDNDKNQITTNCHIVCIGFIKDISSSG
ncbi:unnamed protein product [Arabidopsis thaliana]|uniref:Uncharacterized protein n=1 Tax=Arabidopsis thaliana TaxID=3702 RepID=A0A654EW55_ARATH|nr:unnamed protein product [Arabidopsis thaliana]